MAISAVVDVKVIGGRVAAALTFEAVDLGAGSGGVLNKTGNGFADSGAELAAFGCDSEGRVSQK